MSLTFLQGVIIAIISLAFGVISAISGGGGGLFVVPSMVATFTDAHNVLLGSVFVMYFVAATSGFVAYARKGLIDYKNGIILAIPTVPGVVVGSFLESIISNFEFKVGLGLITVMLSLAMLQIARGSIPITSSSIVEFEPIGGNHLKPNDPVPKHGNNQKIKNITDVSGRTFTYRPHIVRGVVLNFAAGLMSGTFGAGAAIIIVPAMILFVRMPSHVAIATSRMVLVVLNLGAVVTHVSIGAINLLYAVALSIGAVFGIFFGAKLVFKMSPTRLTKIMALVFILLGAYLIISSF